ncbi:energy-coupling factor transporter transmembrane component T [uncultured Varibaculum sp.]|uniref:energy-coupling factor transporter transmembrane component T n=1 Tax=uncultured Varibaculum sp. TaxID=413896 RepID=UPI0025897718|nr:energy-coupling factor transporter transmembrane component T [uncultured Varibaculum sp.]
MTDSPVANLNPITKILAILCFGISALVWPDFIMGLLIIILLFIISAIARILRSFTKIMFGFGIPVSIMLFFIQGFFSPRNKRILLDFGFGALGLEGVLYAAKIIVTVLVFVGSFYIMNKTSYIGLLVASLTSIGLPSKIGYLVLASLNVVPQMQRRMALIRDAQNSRGLSTGGGLLSRVKALTPLIGPVILSSLTDAQERGMTLETRGFGIRGVKRTNFIEVKWSFYDKTLIWGMGFLTLLTVLFAVFIYIGFLPYWGELL